jgi:TonB family protein
MTPAQALSIDTIWQQWERRIVNARFPLLQYLGGSRHSAFYLTEFSGAKAALKLIPAGTPRTAAQIACWKIAARLSHPNLLKILDAGLWHADQDQDMYFAVMEYCDESLADVLRQRQITAAEAREILTPTLSVLKYLHSQGLLHGQIKPAHLLANGDQLKLSCDTIHRNGEGHPSAIESPYDAPEKASGTISLTGDVWSLGITLFEAFTGHLPGADRNGDAKAAEKLPAPFDAIVAGCMARDREQRLSLSAIRALLDKPVPKSVSEAKPDADAAKNTNVIVLPAAAVRSEVSSPSRMEVIRPNPSPPKIETPARPTSAKPELSLRELTPKPFVAGIVLLCIIAIAIGIRLTRKPAAATPAASVKVAATAEVAPPAHTTAAQAAPPKSSGAVLHQVMPEITGQAQSTIQGTVKVGVRVTVDPRGQVTRAALNGRSPSVYFGRQTLEAARQWTFLAPIRDGKPQSSDWALRFEFRRSGATVSARMISRP